MMDIHCAKCGEPWDAYGVRHGDMEPAESQRFLKGEGCPSCQFGTACVACDGTGVDFETGPQPECSVCHNHRRITIRRLTTSDGFFVVGAGPWMYHYDPSSKPVPTGVDPIEGSVRFFQCKEGMAQEGWAECWACRPDQYQRCLHCDGDGKLRVKNDKEALFRVVGDLLGGDEDGQDAELSDLGD